MLNAEERYTQSLEEQCRALKDALVKSQIFIRLIFEGGIPVSQLQFKEYQEIKETLRKALGE